MHIQHLSDQCRIQGGVLGPIYFIFMQFFGKKLQINRLAHSLRELQPPHGKSWIRHCWDQLSLPMVYYSVADPGLPRGHANFRGEGALTYYLAHLLPKTAWKWKRNGLRRLERTQPANLGVLTYYLAIFSPKAAWKWKKLDGKEGGAAHPPPSPIRQCYTFSRAAHCLYFIFMEVFGKII